MTRHILAAALVLASLVACGDQGSTGTKVGVTPTGATSSSVATAKPATIVQTTFKVGDQVAVNDVVLVVNGATSSVGSEYQKPTAGQYLLVAVSLQNTGATPVRVSSVLNFELRDDTGQTYNMTFLSGVPAAPDGVIAPGDRLAGTLVYDTPKGKGFRFYFKSTIFAGKQAIVELGAH